jgi:dTDP-4-dehydrorhamnose reductase
MEFTALTRAELDLADPASVEAAASRSEWVCRGPYLINCAAWTDVDGAEENEARATAVNGLTGLVRIARSWEAVTVTFSTDYVFGGRASTPYAVETERAPLSAYGRSKAVGEETLEAFPEIWFNIRTSWLYEAWGKNFVLTMRKLLMEKPVVRVVNDQRGRPTSATHLARTTLALLDRASVGSIAEFGGHWHITDGGECTWYEFATEIGRISGAPGRVEPCTTAEFPRPAKRPAYSVLDLSRTEELLGPMPDWRGNLADVLRRVGP